MTHIFLKAFRNLHFSMGFLGSKSGKYNQVTRTPRETLRFAFFRPCLRVQTSLHMEDFCSYRPLVGVPILLYPNDGSMGLVYYTYIYHKKINYSTKWQMYSDAHTYMKKKHKKSSIFHGSVNIPILMDDPMAGITTSAEKEKKEKVDPNFWITHWCTQGPWDP